MHELSSINTKKKVQLDNLYRTLGLRVKWLWALLLKYWTHFRKTVSPSGSFSDRLCFEGFFDSSQSCTWVHVQCWVGSDLMWKRWSEPKAWVRRQETRHSPALPQLGSRWNTNCREVRVDAHGTEKLPHRQFYVRFFLFHLSKTSPVSSAQQHVLFFLSLS